MEYQDIFSPQTLEKLNKKSAETLKDMLGNKTLMQTLISSQDILNQIAKAEAPYKSQLEQLAVNMMKELYPVIDEEGIIIDAKLGSISDVNKSLDETLTPEGRRRIINGITQGAALKGAFAFYLFKEHLDELDPSLVEKYSQIMKNSFGIYHDPNAVAMMLAQLAQGQKMAGGSSKVIMKEVEDSGITIKARAICFPMLIHEINKGLHELISLQGFKGDKAANQAVVNKVDTLANEPNDIKYGQIIYEALNDLFIDSKYSDDSRLREYFLQDVYQLEDDEFLSLVENSINEEITPQQRKWVDNTLRDIKDDLKADDYDSTGLDENFNFKKYLSEGKLLKEIEIVRPGEKITQDTIDAFAKYRNTQPKPIRPLKLKLGKYNVSGEELGIKLTWEEGKSLLSPKTRQNAEALFITRLGIEPQTIMIGKVPDRWAFSFYIIGQSNDGQTIIMARKETGSSMAGQTYLITPSFKVKLNKWLEDNENPTMYGTTNFTNKFNFKEIEDEIVI